MIYADPIRLATSSQILNCTLLAIHTITEKYANNCWKTRTSAWLAGMLRAIFSVRFLYV